MEKIRDYVDKLRVFYEQQKSFTCKFYNVSTADEQYKEFISRWLTQVEEFSYKIPLNKKGQSVIENLYYSEIYSLTKYEKKIDVVMADIKKARATLTSDENWAFITVGWNEQEVTPKQMLRASENIASLKYFNSVKFVLEKHRENGIHHHTHFLVKYTEKLYTSKLVDWIFQTRGVRTICLKKNFVYIQGPLNKKNPYQPLEVYEDYIIGKKKEEKLKYVELDKKWRKSNGFLDLYTSENI